jgi:hypothetical protein
MYTQRPWGFAISRRPLIGFSNNDTDVRAG